MRAREVTFAVEGGALLMAVLPRRGRPYEHRCLLGVFEEVARAIDARADSGVVIDDVFRATELPHSQIAVAIAFMKERGCLEVRRRRRSFPTSTFFFEDAMVEYHALEHGSEGART